MALAPLEIDNGFWRFSLSVYGRPGVAEECLKLQDRFGADVNLLLYCAWCGLKRADFLSEDDLAALERRIEAWNEGAIYPLRHARRAIKALPEFSDKAVAGVRKEVAALEIAAEQIAQAMLYAQAAPERPGSAEIAAANVELYLQRLARAVPAGEAVATPALLEATAAFEG